MDGILMKTFKLGDNILDKWLISKLETLTENVNREMDNYHLFNVVPQLFNFIEDLTNWYIRLNRRRFWDDGLTDDKCSAYSSLYFTLKEVSKIMAPFAPFLSEHIFLELKAFGEIKEESVHLCDYPSADSAKIDQTLEDAVDRMQQIILLGRQKRNQKQIKVKTPLSTLTVIHQDKELLEEISKLEEYIQTELNIKKITYDTNEENFIKLYAKANARVLGKKLGKDMAKYMGLITKLSSAELNKVEAGQNITVGDKELSPEDILIFREAKEGSEALSNRIISIDIDCELTEELIDEGLAREVVNRIQKTRKDINFNVADRIKVAYFGSEKICSVIEKHQEYIAKETLSTEFNKVESEENAIEFEIEGNKISLCLTKN